jgi:L-lactate dehydrogenase complex protein LldG
VKEQFAARAREVGAEVHFVSGAEAAVKKVGEILVTRKAELAMISPDLGQIGPNLERALARHGLRLISGDSPPWEAERADAGVTGAVMGVAETGSVLVEGNDLFPRLATMLPLVHVVLLREASIAPSLEEVGEHLRRSAMGEGGAQVRYASLVTGPSRTADVEKTLSTGVHGPGELHIVLF